LVEVECGIIETVFVKLIVRQLISRLELVIVGQVFLNCIVCEMDTLADLSSCELLRSSANVALFVPKEF
jgi:hypothetical protein